ncbi:hypothetical protein IWQ61_010341, partial [Dispira simplex]
MDHPEPTLSNPPSHLENSEPCKPFQGRRYTVSIALPGSIVDNAQSAELRTYLAGQIARAAAVFNVDEIVVFDDTCRRKSQNQHSHRRQLTTGESLHGLFESASQQSDPNLFMARVLQYLETPQYLRKLMFPMHPDLRYAGLLNPLDCPHHVRMEETSLYREGFTVQRKSKAKACGYANCGLRKDVQLDRPLQSGLRVTVKMDNPTPQEGKIATGKVVSPKAPREQSGLYWGYQVRLANSISQALQDSPYPDGYDLIIGTSERGETLDQARGNLPVFRHILVVFGGVNGLEPAVDADESLTCSGEDAHTLFHHWLNTCPNQGSRTIRTE